MRTFVYKLKVLSGPEKGKSFLLAQERYTVGRGTDNLICLMDMAASKNHFEVIRSGDHYYIKDLRSKNGTYLNGVRLAAKQFFDLPPGSEIKIGGTLIHVGMEEREEEDSEDLEQDTLEAELEPAPAMGSATGYMSVAGGPSAGRLRKMKERTIPFTIDSGRNVAGIYKVLSIVGSTADRDFLMRKSVDLILEIVEAERGFLFLSEQLFEDDFHPVVARSAKAEGEVPMESISRSVLGAVVDDGSPVLCTEVASDHRFAGTDSLVEYNIQSVICAPIKSRDGVLGLLYFDTTSTTKLLRREDLELITALGIQIGIIMENMELVSGYQDIFVSLSAAMINLMEANYEGYEGHSRRVAGLSMALAYDLGLSRRIMEGLHLAAILHDIGQFSIRPETMNNPAALGPDELAAVRGHPGMGKAVIGRIRTFDRVVDGILGHHERWDGSGYPSGLKGEDIPLSARIIGVAEVFDALTSPRPHRKALEEEEALREIVKGGGTLYDSRVVKALEGLVRKGKIPPKS
jgi:HD-GYP domain-containing protein (c-di-GMP phosphodiesterase class II)